MPNNEIISITIPFYNHSEFLDECVDSILNQSSGNFLITIVDDGSTEIGVKELLEKQKDKDRRITVLDHHRNRGISAGRNTGVAHNRDIFWHCVFDADNIMYKHFVQWHLDTIGKIKANFYYTGVRYVNQTGAPIKELIPTPYNKEIILSSAFISQAFLFNIDDWTLVGGFKEDCKICEDWEFLLNLVKHNKKGFAIPKCLFDYRLHSNSITEQLTSHRNYKAIILPYMKSLYPDMNVR